MHKFYKKARNQFLGILCFVIFFKICLLYSKSNWEDFVRISGVYKIIFPFQLCQLGEQKTIKEKIHLRTLDYEEEARFSPMNNKESFSPNLFIICDQIVATREPCSQVFMGDLVCILCYLDTFEQRKTQLSHAEGRLYNYT